MWRICWARSTLLTGTKTPDARLTPKIAQHSSMHFGSTMATRSPRDRPFASNDAAHRATSCEKAW